MSNTKTLVSFTATLSKDEVREALKPDSTPRTLVCAKCLTACCWHGEFYCDEYKTAGLVRATESQLRKLDLEHPDYFMPHLKSGHDNPAEPILTTAMMERDE